MSWYDYLFFALAVAFIFCVGVVLGAGWAEAAGEDTTEDL